MQIIYVTLCVPQMMRSLTLRVPARRALHAAFFVTHDAAAIRAHADDIAGDMVFQLFFALGDLIVELFFGADRRCGFGLDLVIDEPAFDDARDGIGAGKDAASLFPGRRRTADAAQLLDDDLDIHP